MCSIQGMLHSSITNFVISVIITYAVIFVPSTASKIFLCSQELNYHPFAEMEGYYCPARL